VIHEKLGRCDEISTFSFQSNNVTIQKKYKAEVSELHDALLQVKRDYDLLRMEFEQNLKANEQTGLTMYQ